MNSIDLALLLVLAVCAARGYWRGFFRETCGLLGLIGGVAAAFQFAAPAAVLVQRIVQLPTAIETGVAFVVIFVVVHAAANLLGVLLDRVTRALFLRGINRLAGAALGVGKGAAVLGFVLLFLHLFPLAPKLDGEIMNSAIGRPLVSAAGDVLRLGLQSATHADDRNQT